MSDYAMIVTNPRLIGSDLTPGETFTAPTRTALVDVLIPGYSQGGPASKDESRYFYLLSVANQSTGVLLADAVAAGQVQMASLEQAEVDALLNSSRTEPIEWGEWQCEVPLVILPQVYGGRPLPTGNVVALDGQNETTTLDSLQKLGAIEVFVKN